jgi:hypothetical protein
VKEYYLQKVQYILVSFFFLFTQKDKIEVRYVVGRVKITKDSNLSFPLSDYTATKARIPTKEL